MDAMPPKRPASDLSTMEPHDRVERTLPPYQDGVLAANTNGANGGAVLPYNEQGWFNTNQGEGLTVTTGSGSTVGVQVCYLEI